MHKILIGLDFDGVLHSTTGENLLANTVYINKLVEELKENNIDCSIVITTTWRKKLSLEKMSSFFSATTQEKIIGVTPDFENYGTNRDLEFSQFRRSYESQHNMTFDLAYAIDDNARLFSDLPMLLFKTDSKEGFNEEKKNEFKNLIMDELNINVMKNSKNKM